MGLFQNLPRAPTCLASAESAVRSPYRRSSSPEAMSDRASEALAEGFLPGEPRTYEAMSKRKDDPLTTLYYRDHGRPSKEKAAQDKQYLTPSEEKALEKHLKLMSDLGNHVRIKFIGSLAFSIARQRSTTDKAIKPPGKNWPRAFSKRHPALKPRGVKAMDWKRHDNNIYDKITHWFEVIGTVLQDPAILPENVYNMDETGVMLCMLGSVKVLVSKDDPRGYRGAGVKRTMVTAIECISANGRSLLPLIIWPATTHRSNWTTFPTPGWHYAWSESGYTDSKISLEWITRVFDPQTKEQANGKPRVLICDGFGTHETLEVLEFCFENNILLCRLPSHTSHKLQPCDVGVFAPLKAAYRDEAERLYRVTNVIGNEHLTSLYSPARDKAFTKRNITAAWAASGLFPLNPDRVLRTIQKPLAQLTIPQAGNMKVGSCLQDEVLKSPVTPVSAEPLTLLHNLIKEDIYTHNEASARRQQRRVQKLANAAQISFAENALLRDQNQMLTIISNEVKVRRSTRSIVLGKAKVMSYEDIEEARAKRAAKEIIKGKGKRGRKRKKTAREEGEAELEPEPELARSAKEAIKRKGKRGGECKSVAAELEPEPELARMTAPVARMI
ncbi:hypothetical protein V494_02772 [Pseudogymnoascus sp. VKM F-4513 (FW-928)]|nr:hypothetical protein V494_02772 [Pseudogymnoascus sp. VKM F-4513 (FW-928)]